MKAAVLIARNKISLRNVPDPVVAAPRDVLIRVRLVGVCGSDLNYFSNDSVGGEPVGRPVILGHECAGVVEAVGRDVTRVRPGDAVAVEPAVSCGACDQCLAGRRHTCRRISFLGHKSEREGALSELLVMPEENCFPLAAGMTLSRAVLAEPLSIALHAVNLAGPLEGKQAAVLGCGPIGLSVGIAARKRGLSRLYMTDVVEHRARAAADWAGADWAGNTAETDVVAEMLRRSPSGLDVVFECCGRQSALDQAVELLKPGGTLAVVGIPVEERVSFPTNRARRKELRVQNVRRQNRCFEEALAMLSSGEVDLDFMATHTFPLEKAQAAFETALERRDGVVKAMIRLD